jgi:hypothetical protein
MQQLRTSWVGKRLAWWMIVALLAPYLTAGTVPALAQGGIKSVTTVAVVPFTDLTRSNTDMGSREMTAAVALALEDSREFVVTSTSDLEREMKALGLRAPLSSAQQIRLGQRLRVDKVLEGELVSLSIDSRTGSGRAEVRIRLLDVGVGEYLDGAVGSVVTRPIPGWTGDSGRVLHEVVRSAAEEAISKMLGSRVRRGSVDLVDDLGNINISLGMDDGVTVGTDFLVMRPVWQPDLEEVIFRRVGIIRVSTADSSLSIAASLQGSMPSTGDRIYRIYKPVAVAAKEAKSKSMKKGGQLVAGMLLLLGLVSIGTGSTTSSASSLTASLSQVRPGADPVVRLTIATGNTAREKTHGYLIFRAANNPDFPAIASYLIDAVPGRSLTYYSDEPFTMRVVEDFEINFQYRSEEGDIEDGSVTVSYNDLPLVRGNRYYYKVSRITDPLYPPGTNPPIGTAQMGTRQLEPIEDPEIDADPDNRVISLASPAAGPITFYVPPTLSSPTANATNQPTTNVSFTWTPVTGANEYIVQVFPGSDPDGVRSPIFQSLPMRETGGAVMSTTIAGPFSASDEYWWRVGARQTSDPRHPVNQMTGLSGWLYSSMRRFTTAPTPPPPPGTATVQPLPSRDRGPWGTGRRSR